jgi:hypothetical protein
MTRTFAKWLGMFLYLPFIVLLLPIIVLGIGIIFINATISGLFQRARWLRDLRRKGRATPMEEMLSAATSGTLIVDRPGLNFKATQCWWTSENIFELSPMPIPTDAERIEHFEQTTEERAHEFNLWCWQRYLSPDTGSAILLTPPDHGEAMATKIHDRMPGFECVMSWSAIPAMTSLTQHATEPLDEREPE